MASRPQAARQKQKAQQTQQQQLLLLLLRVSSFSCQQQALLCCVFLLASKTNKKKLRPPSFLGRADSALLRIGHIFKCLSVTVAANYSKPASSKSRRLRRSERMARRQGLQQWSQLSSNQTGNDGLAALCLATCSNAGDCTIWSPQLVRSQKHQAHTGAAQAG